MKKTVFLILITLILGAASAQSSLSFQLDDQDYTYFGSKVGYLSLSLEDNVLVVHLSNQTDGMKIRFSKIATPRRTELDGSGKAKRVEADYRRDSVAREKLAKLIHCEVSRDWATLGHENSSIYTVVKLYREALGSLGFEPEPGVTFRGIAQEYVFRHGNQRLQVSFAQVVDDGDQLVRVRLSAV